MGVITGVRIVFGLKPLRPIYFMHHGADHSGNVVVTIKDDGAATVRLGKTKPMLIRDHGDFWTALP